MKSALLTLLIFLLAQALGAILLCFCGTESVTLLSLILMGVNILAVLGCHFLLHNIKFKAAFNVSSVKWKLGLLAVLGSILGALSISILTDGVELPQSMLETSLAMSHDFCGVVAIVLVGPLTEELLFREAIAGEMLHRGASSWMAIMVSALTFSAMHLNFAQGLYALPLGILLGIIYCKSGNIVLTSLLHILNNGIVVALLFIFGKSAADVSCTSLFGNAYIAHAIMLLLGSLCIAVMIHFWKHYPSPTEQPTTDFAVK